MNEFALDSHRELFPALANKSYFNYGGQGVLAQPTLDAVLEAFSYIQRQGPFGIRTNSWVAQVAQRTRHSFAQTLGVLADTVTLTEDVTVGCNIALWGLDWQEGDHIVLTDCEHPGVVASIQEIQRRFGVKATMIPLLEAVDDRAMVALVQANLRPTTKLVVLSHVLWNTGQVLPMADLVTVIKGFAANQEIRLLVDAAQSVGMLPLNLAESGIDFYAFTGHKWCCGPEGVGGLYVSEEARSVLRPTFIGWRSLNYEAATGGGLLMDGRQYEIATSAYPLYAGLVEAIESQNRWGDRDTRYQRICNLSKYLWQRLQATPGVQCVLPAPPLSGLVSFRLMNGNHEQVVQRLEADSIYIRNIVYPDSLRACVHYLTTVAEIDRLVGAIAALNNR
jgi:L-cysteine/cystine lyase